MTPSRRVFEYSDHGVPRLINKICKLALKACETNGSKTVTPEIVAAIGERFKRFTRDDKIDDEEPAAEAAPAAEKPKKTRKSKAVEAETPADKSEATIIPIVPGGEPAVLEDEPLQVAASAHINDAPSSDTRIGFFGSASYIQAQREKDFTDKASFYPEGSRPATDAAPDAESAPEYPDRVKISPVQVCMDELVRTGALDKAKGVTRLERMKMAGQLAAEEIKKHPEVVGIAGDPVVMWKELRNEILTAVGGGK